MISSKSYSVRISSSRYGADLVLQVDLLRRELVLELGDLLERERVVDGERHLLRHRGEELRVGDAERLAVEPAHAERSKPAVAHRERHAAHRLDAFGKEQARDLGPEHGQVRPLEPSRLAGREGESRGRPFNRNEHVLFDQPLARKLERPHVEPAPLRVVDSHAGVVVGHDAAETAGDLAEECASVEVRDERVVNLEEQLEAVTFRCQLLVMERIVDGERNLARELLQEVDVGVAERVIVPAAEAESAEPPQGRRQGYIAERLDPIGPHDLRGGGKSCLAIDVLEDERSLRLPGDAGRRFSDRQLEDVGAERLPGKREETHDVPPGVVQHERHASERDHPAQYIE